MDVAPHEPEDPAHIIPHARGPLLRLPKESPLNEIWPDAALILVGHGSSRLPDASLPTRSLAESLASSGRFGEVVCCFHKEAPFLPEGLGLVSASRVFVVPNFLADGFYTNELIPREMGLSGPMTVTLLPDGRERRIHYTRPVGTHPALGGMIANQALLRGKALGWDESQTELMLVAHGSSRNAAPTAVARIADDIAALHLFRNVHIAYLEQAPYAQDWPSLVRGDRLLVAPLLLSQGMHASRDLPTLFGTDPASGQGFRSGTRTALCPLPSQEPGMLALVLDKVREAESAEPRG